MRQISRLSVIAVSTALLITLPQALECYNVIGRDI